LTFPELAETFERLKFKNIIDIAISVDTIKTKDDVLPINDSFFIVFFLYPPIC